MKTFTGTVKIRKIFILLFVIYFLFTGSLFSQKKPQIPLKHGVVKITTDNNKTGTGFIVQLEAGNAIIATAPHVIAAARKIKIEFFTKKNVTFPAKVLFQEPLDPAGVAVLRVADSLPKGLRALSLDAYSKLKEGDQVLVIGNPILSGIPWTTTKGSIVGRKGKVISFTGNVEEGNSGGPLMLNGRVVGMVTDTAGNFSRATVMGALLISLEGLGIQPRHTHYLLQESSKNARLIAGPRGLVAVIEDGLLLRLWYVPTGRMIREVKYPLTARLGAVCFSPDGRLLVEGDARGQVRIRHNASGRVLRKFTKVRHSIKMLSCAPGGKDVAVLYSKGGLRMLSIGSGASRFKVKLNQKENVEVLTFSKNGKFLALGGKNSIRILNAKNGKLHRKFPGVRGIISGLAFRNAFLVSSEKPISSQFVRPESPLRLWELAGARRIRNMQDFYGRPLALSSRGEFALLVPPGKGVIRQWSLGKERLLRILRGHEKPVSQAVVSPDGQFAVSGDRSGVIRVWPLK